MFDKAQIDAMVAVAVKIAETEYAAGYAAVQPLSEEEVARRLLEACFADHRPDWATRLDHVDDHGMPWWND